MRKVVIGWIVGLLLCEAGETSAQPAAKRPADVYVHVARARGELQLIRFHMGKRKNPQTLIGVTEAAPREVFFQALTLFRKANQLCFDHTRERLNEPGVPRGDILPAHVFSVVDAALGRIRKVRLKLDPNAKPKEPPFDKDKSPNDVFRSIVQANRQLNILLDQQFTPSDVFQRVTRAVGYAARLLEHFEDATPIPEPGPFVAGKRPADVYRRLLKCFEQIRLVAEKSKVGILKLKVTEKEVEAAEPGDVYDIASLLVSELTYFHSRLPNAKQARRAFFPGRKFPSHVFQRAGILEKQCQALVKHVNAKPGWLGGKPAERTDGK